MGMSELPSPSDQMLGDFQRVEVEQLQLVPTPEVQRMRQLAEYRATAEKCFPNPDRNGRIFPQVVHGPKDGETSLEYLQAFSGDPDRLEEILSPTGQWLLTEPRYDPFEERLDNVERYLRGTYDTLYDLCEFSPDGVSAEGYNRHGFDHHIRVERTGKHLLELADVSEEEMLRATIAKLSHDIGYILDRDAHALVGGRMLPVIFPLLATSYAEIDGGHVVSNLDLIRRAIENHDSDILRHNLENIYRLPENLRLSALASFLRPSGLATAIADKEDIGRRRISKNIKSEVIKGDPHAEVNFWGESKGISLFADRAKWKLQFEEEITDADKRAWPTWARGLSRDIDRGTYRQHFHEWLTQFHTLYSERAVFMTEALLALFPQIKGVELEFSDRYGVRSTETFERGNLDYDIKKYREANDPRNGSGRR